MELMGIGSLKSETCTISASRKPGNQPSTSRSPAPTSLAQMPLPATPTLRTRSSRGADGGSHLRMQALLGSASAPTALPSYNSRPAPSVARYPYRGVGPYTPGTEDIPGCMGKQEFENRLWMVRERKADERGGGREMSLWSCCRIRDRLLLPHARQSRT
ncbi:hypothetical protein B0O99DRAFT_614027 [Bisporella sp. PMI_857]|nr:hypothetical protein B0O99DRAFT_614027 [Bisporella sp. PMI_857]